MSINQLRNTYLFVTTIILMIGAGVMQGGLTFGHGLGDLGMIIIIPLISIAWGIVVYVKSPYEERKAKTVRVLLLIGLLLTLLYFILYISILRGGENPWDGSIFV